MILPPDLKARGVKLELFEQGTQEALQDELELWLESRTEEVLIGISFEASSIDGTNDSYRAQVLYTE